MPMINCAEGALVNYVPSADMPWNLQRATHLFRRIALGTDLDVQLSALTQNPVNVVNRIVDDAYDLPLTPEPQWAFWSLNDYSPNEDIRTQQFVDQLLTWGGQWLEDIKNNGLRDRMSFFWHNHFVTRQEDYLCPSWMYQYHKLLQQYALGNFKEFVRAMGKTPAMLVYLNGIQNTRFDPNENYARELYELFTLGVDNGYTQDDIVETAKALTGWNDTDLADFCNEINFLPAFWDPGQKTIFGRTGNWGYDDVVDILFEERPVEISEHICGKLYRHFVNPKEDLFIIEALAKTFRDNNFELRPVLKQMFSSEHFFDKAHIGTVIPGHIEYFFTFVNEMGFANNSELNFAIGYSAGDFNQAIMNPTDVAGWPGNRDWINSASLPYRWENIANVIAFYYQINGMALPELINFAKTLAEGKENDEVLITRRVIDFFLPKGYQSEIEYEEALKVFKSEIPENYFEDGSWNLDWEYAPAQMFFLINHIANSPEFQLK